jgi:hypothetical protein
MSQASAQPVDFKVGRHFDEGQVSTASTIAGTTLFNTVLAAAITIKVTPTRLGMLHRLLHTSVLV